MSDKRLTDFGLRLPRELGGDPAALVEALQSLPAEPTDDEREGFGERVLAAMPPKRAADKRKAVAQRTSREGAYPSGSDALAIVADLADACSLHIEVEPLREAMVERGHATDSLAPYLASASRARRPSRRAGRAVVATPLRLRVSGGVIEFGFVFTVTVS